MRLAARLDRAERNIRALGKPQLANSSVEGGGSIDVNSEDGTTVMQVGGQFDGSYVAATLVGPTPPTMSAPILEPAPGAVIVRWDGTFTDAHSAPMDWARGEVHASTTPNFDAAFATTLRGTIETPRGNELAITLPAGELHYFKFVARSLAGSSGPASAESSESAAAIGVDPAVLAQIDADVAAAQAAADAVALEVDGIPTLIATAKGEAITASADTAQGKADAAQAAAISAAAATAQAKADQAKADALTAAAVTAQEKADAAKAQAIADATAQAATTAQTKADLAQATAINAAQDYVQSRGTNLVTNGTGLLGDNTNFSKMTFTKTDAPTGMAGSFVSTAGTSAGIGGGYPMTDELIPVDPGKKFRLSFYARQTGASSASPAYAFAAPFDAFRLDISPVYYMFVAGTATTLAAPLNPGDTTVTLTSSAGFYGRTGQPAGDAVWHRALIFWDYVDPGGKAWAQETYSRNWYGYDLWADGGITGNVITLRAPWAGPAKASGTKLSNGSAGGTYMYGGLAYTVVPKAWTAYADSVVGVVSDGTQASFITGWPPGTAFCKIGFLPNYDSDPTSQHAFAGISFSDATAAAYDANNIGTNQLLDGAVVYNKIAADQIGAAHLIAGSVVAGKIATDAVTANTVSAGAIVAGKLAADAVVASNLAADSVLARNIKAGEITAAKMVAGTITAESGVIGSIDATKITVGTIQANQLAATAVDGKTITGALVRTAASGERWELTGVGALKGLRGYSGLADETASAGMETTVSGLGLTGGSGTVGALRLFAPERASDDYAGKSELALSSGGNEIIAGGGAGGYSPPTARLASKEIKLGAKRALTLGLNDGTGDDSNYVKGSANVQMMSDMLDSGSRETSAIYLAAIEGSASSGKGGINVEPRKVRLYAGTPNTPESKLDVDKAAGVTVTAPSFTVIAPSVAITAPSVTFDGSISAPSMSPVYVKTAGGGSTFTSTTASAFASPTQMAGLTFVAPPSGAVKITTSCLLKGAADNSAAFCQFEIRTGSSLRAGTVVHASANGEGVANYNVQYVQASGAYFQVGLTPGATYNVYISVWAAAVGAIFTNSTLLVEPSL